LSFHLKKKNSFYEQNGCSANIAGTTGFLEHECITYGRLGSYEYIWPHLNVYVGSRTCYGTPTASFNLQLYGCSNTAGTDAYTVEDTNNPYLTVGSYEKWSYVNEGIRSQLGMSFGALTAVLLVVLQLFKN
jgi:hypothetical protein